MDLEVEVCSHTQPAAAVLPRKIMNALPSRATMLPRCQAAQTALHKQRGALALCLWRCLWRCSQSLRSIPESPGNFPAHPSSESAGPSRRALRKARRDGFALNFRYCALRVASMACGGVCSGPGTRGGLDGKKTARFEHRCLRRRGEESGVPCAPLELSSCRDPSRRRSRRSRPWAAFV